MGEEIREIKFRYILEVDNTSKDDPAYYTWQEIKIFTLDELENGKLNDWIIKEFYGVVRTIARNLYTGFKDKNGKEIYENDITNLGLVVWVDDEELSEFVGWHIKSLFKNKYNKYEYYSFWAFNIPYEIDGNIYENPELLNK